jgi:hypothetical protein
MGRAWRLDRGIAMKHFTMDWWANQCEPPSVCDDYKNYIESVRDALPESIQAFLDGHMLHDSIVRELSVQPANETVKILADGFDVNLDRSVVYELEYAGVMALTIHGDASEDLPGPAGLGHLGYDEFEPLDTGGIEHRLLFSSGVEILIRFRDFRFTATPAGNAPVGNSQ